MTSLLLVALLGAVVEERSGGHIDWTEGLLHAASVSPQSSGARADYEVLEQSAFSQLETRLETLSTGVRVDCERTASELVAQGGETQRLLDAGRSEWHLTEARYYTSGRVELEGQLSLHAWLRPILVADAQGDGEGTPSEYTGLIIDARTLRLTPVVAPHVVDVDGASLFSLASLSPSHAGERLPAVWVQDPADPAAVARAGDHPLIVAAASTRRGCEVALAGDASTQVAALAGSNVLVQGRVVLVVDP
jgi:hypothetical protein